MDKLKTGVPGLDELLKGGFNSESSLLVIGAPGTGKSILALQFMYEGCKKNDPCLYITCEESPESIKEYSKELGMDFTKFEKSGVMTFLKEDIAIRKPISIAQALNIIKTKGVKRVVLDSLTYFEYATSSSVEFRKSLLEFLHVMKENKVTTMVTSQEGIANLDEMRYKPQDFLFDGIILLMKLRKGSTFERCLNVVKVRGQSHLLDIYPFKIEKGGVHVYTNQIPFSLK